MNRITSALLPTLIVASACAAHAQDLSIPQGPNKYRLEGQDSKLGDFKDEVTIRGARAVLRRGHGGTAVRFLQEALNRYRAGQGQPAIAVDGAFGPGTEAAVHDYQRRNGLALGPADLPMQDRLGAAYAYAHVTRVTRYGNRRRTMSGTGRYEGNGRILATLAVQEGASNRISGISADEPDTRYDFQLRGDGAVEAWHTVGEIRRGRASGQLKSSPQPAEPSEPSADEEEDEDGANKPRTSEIKQEGRHLLAVAKREVVERIREAGANLAYDGVKLEQDFKLSQFFHVGVGGKVEALRESELSPEQALTSRSKRRHVWIKSHVQGGVKIPLKTTIPVGSVNVSLGFEPGARVDYYVTDIYPIPNGIRDVRTAVSDLKWVAKRSFDLPLNASEAQSMTVGATRVFDGQASIAVSGALGIGHEVADIEGVVKVGASARVGGFYKIQGDMRIEVARLDLDRVRVRVTRGKTHQYGREANLFVGASIDKAGAREALVPTTEYIDEALIDTSSMSAEQRALIIGVGQEAALSVANKIVKKLVRFQINAKQTNTASDELDLSYRFDLHSAGARKAYEDAVRGDLRAAERLSKEPDGGVYREYRVVEVETVTHRAASLELSVLLKIGASRTIRLQDISVDDEDGVRRYEVFRFNRNFDLEIFEHERRKRVSIEVIRRTTPNALPAERVKSSFRFSVDILDPITRTSEANRLRRLMNGWALDASSNLPTPEAKLLQSRYGETRTKITVGISDRGLNVVLGRSQREAFEAYVLAYTVIEGKEPLWGTERGRQRIANSAHDDNDRYRQQRAQMERALDFANNLRALGQARSASERARAMKAIASDARYDLYAVASLTKLAPGDTITIDASILGDRIRVVDGRRGDTYRVPVADPRPSR